MGGQKSKTVTPTSCKECALAQKTMALHFLTEVLDLNQKRKTLEQTWGNIPHKVNFSSLLCDNPTFDYQSLTYISQDYSDSSDSDEGCDLEFPPPTEKLDVLLGDMAQPQLDMSTEPDSAPNWSPVQSMYRVAQKSSMSKTRTSLEIFLVINWTLFPTKYSLCVIFPPSFKSLSATLSFLCTFQDIL